MGFNTIYILPGIVCFVFAIMERGKTDKILLLPVPLGILFCIYAVTRYYNLTIISSIVMFVVFLMIVVYPSFKKSKDKRARNNT